MFYWTFWLQRWKWVTKLLRTYDGPYCTNFRSSNWIKIWPSFKTKIYIYIRFSSSSNGKYLPIQNLACFLKFSIKLSSLSFKTTNLKPLNLRFEAKTNNNNNISQHFNRSFLISLPVLKRTLRIFSYYLIAIKLTIIISIHSKSGKKFHIIKTIQVKLIACFGTKTPAKLNICCCCCCSRWWLLIVVTRSSLK